MSSVTRIDERLAIRSFPAVTEQGDELAAPAEASCADGEVGGGAEGREKVEDSRVGNAAAVENEPGDKGDDGAAQGDGFTEVRESRDGDRVEVF